LNISVTFERRPTQRGVVDGQPLVRRDPVGEDRAPGPARTSAAVLGAN
jgi:hypothetical protein